MNATKPTLIDRSPFRLLGTFILLAPALAAAEATAPVGMVVQNVPGAVLVSHLPASTPLNVSIALQPTNRAALQAYVDASNTPNNPLYRRFLEPKELGNRFGASAATVASTVAYLKGKGLTVTLSSDSRLTVLAKGTAATVEKAFGITLNLYSAPGRKDGPKTFFSYAKVPQLPKSLASKVVAIGGIQSAYVPQHAGTLTFTQTRTLYNTTPVFGTAGRKGDGVTVGITNYDAYRLLNLPPLYAYYNLPAPDRGVGSNVTKVSIDGGNGENDPIMSGEGDLDIEMVLGAAPRCNLRIYDAGADNYDAIALLSQMVQDNVVDIDTESYGFGLDANSAVYLTALYDQHLLLAAEGVTYLCASGDVGTYGFDYPSTDLDVLSVGGTYTTVAADGTRLSENGWEGSGGGYRAFDVFWNRRPVYQLAANSLVPFPVSASLDRRLFPDVALQANGSNTFDDRDPRSSGSGGYSTPAYYLFFNGGFGAGSGTSAASPLFAGQLATVLQDLKAQDLIDVLPSGKVRLGRIQDFLYGTVGQDPTVFYDVTTGDNGPLANGMESEGGLGWDFVTGFGAPNIGGLRDAYYANSLIAVSDAASSTALYALASPKLILGSNVQGGADSLVSADGTTYSLQSVSQTGVGQVAGTTIGFALNGDATLRRTASVRMALSAPPAVAQFVYLRNYSSRSPIPVYDLAVTVAGTGAMSSVNLPAIDLTKYVKDNAVEVLVRGLKPARLGEAPFRLSIDMAKVVEQVRRG